MIQGGDPTGTGRGGTSIYGQRLYVLPFQFAVEGFLFTLNTHAGYRLFFLLSSEDEIHPELRFTGAGILAMANSGPNTNGTLFTNHTTFCASSRARGRFSILHLPRADALP